MSGLNDSERRLLDTFLSGCDDMAAKIDGLHFADEVDASIKKRYLFYFSKAVRTFKAFTVLVKEGYIDEAQLLSRANFELLVDIELFDKEPEHNAEKLDCWFAASNWSLVPESQTQQAAIERAKAEFCKRYGFDTFPLHWSGMGRISRRAEAAGMMDTYKTTYAFQSGLAHGDTYAVACYLDFSSRDAVGLRVTPDWSDASQAVGQGCMWVLHCLHHIEGGLKLDCYDLVHSLHQAFGAYASKLLGL